jgi:hypothetical protein
MVAPASNSFNDPPCPLPPELRSDVAYRRACGHPWDAIGLSVHYDPDALRRATENDPEFAAVQEKAWAEATWEGQADGMRRLRLLANGSDDAKALKAAKILVDYAAERLRNETHVAVERIRAEARLAVEQARAEARVAVEQARAERRAAGAEEVRVPPAPVKPETDEERAVRVAWETAEDAVEQSQKARPDVYIWGGKHSLGREVGPDESDTRVRIKPDWSCGLGGRHVVYWVVPDPPPPEAHMPGEPAGRPDAEPADRTGAGTPLEHGATR